MFIDELVPPSDDVPTTSTSWCDQPDLSNTDGRRDSGAVGHAAAEPKSSETPATSGNMLAKMQQQRQRMLAKQRSVGVASAAMVTVNELKDVAGSPTGKNRAETGGAEKTIEPETQEDESPRVAVQPVVCENPDAEAERRENLQRTLSQRGISSVFEPVDLATRDTLHVGMDSIAPSDFKAVLHEPVPKKWGMVQCKVVRDRAGGISSRLSPKYVLESASGNFLLLAQKSTLNKSASYFISCTRTVSRQDADSNMGKVQSDFLGVEWTAFGPGTNPTKVDAKLPEAEAIRTVREELANVKYAASVWNSAVKGPRMMSVALPLVKDNNERLVCRTLTPQVDGLSALEKLEERQEAGFRPIEILTNKAPKWNDKIGAYVLNFNKRVTEASVKNFQLVDTTDHDLIRLQFGRVGKQEFNMDFRHPLSPFQAFAICLSSFEHKYGCE